jgi:stress response protein YsnF
VASDNESVTIPMVREDVGVARERVETGVVSVRKMVHERVELIDEPMLHDGVDVEHVAINRAVGGA